MLSVVAVTPLYPPASLVGAWLSTHQCLRSLVARGHQVTAAQCVGRMRAYEHEGVTVVSSLRGRSHILELVRRADVVISHANDAHGIMAAVEATDTPHVRMAHGAGSRVNGADLLIFNSEALRAATPHDGASIVIHPPVHPDEYRTRRRDPDAITLMNCSRDKGVHTAWRLAELFPERTFLGVKGHTGQQVVPRAPNFEQIPATPDPRTVYARTRILLMPSAYETWGRVGVEAMCSGIPVIAHPTPGLTEALGDAGFFHDRDDVDAWAKTVRRLDDPAEYRKASRAAFKRAAELDPTSDLARFADVVEAVAAHEEVAPDDPSGPRDALEAQAGTA